MYWTLRIAGPRQLQAPSPFVTVSLQDSDFSTLNQVHIRDHKDTNMISYARLLNRLLDLGAQNIFVHWQPDAFPSGSRYGPLLSVVEKAKTQGRSLYFATHPALFKNLASEFKAHAKLLEADPCDTHLQTVCMYDEAWQNWIMQKLSTLYWRKPTSRDSFARQIPPPKSYLLHYNNYSDFADFSFHEIMELRQQGTQVHPSFFQGKTVFVGNSVVQGKEGMFKASDTNRVKTVLDPLQMSTRRFGTPLHKFWAQQAQMFHDNALVAVASKTFSLSMALLLALSIIVFLHRFGAMYSLAVFLAFAGASLLCNVLAIIYFNIYFPVFDSLYAGLLAFVLATFAKLSIESFYHWRLRIQEKSDSELVSAKSNFISLLSHNLNTPVAKMQGILSAVESFCPNEALQTDLKKAQKLVTTIQVAIRSVLVTTALEEHDLNHEPITITSFVKNFRESMLKTLERLGINVILSIHDSELSQMPLRFDKRALIMGLASFLILLQKNLKKQVIHLEFAIEEGDTAGLKCTFTGDNSTDWKDSWLNPDHQQSDFLQEVASAALTSLIKTYTGQIEVEGSRARLRLFPYR